MAGRISSLKGNPQPDQEEEMPDEAVASDPDSANVVTADETELDADKKFEQELAERVGGPLSLEALNRIIDGDRSPAGLKDEPVSGDEMEMKFADGEIPRPPRMGDFGSVSAHDGTTVPSPPPLPPLKPGLASDSDPMDASLKPDRVDSEEPDPLTAELMVNSPDATEETVTAYYRHRLAELQKRREDLAEAARRMAALEQQGGGGNVSVSLLGALVGAWRASGRHLDAEARQIEGARIRLSKEFADRMLTVRRRQAEAALDAMREARDEVQSAVNEFNRRFLETEHGKRFHREVEAYASAMGITREQAEAAVRRGVTDTRLEAARKAVEEAFRDQAVIDSHRRMHDAVDRFADHGDRLESSLRTLSENQAVLDRKLTQFRMNNAIEKMSIKPPIVDKPGEAEQGKAIADRMRKVTEGIKQVIDRVFQAVGRLFGMRM